MEQSFTNNKVNVVNLLIKWTDYIKRENFSQNELANIIKRLETNPDLIFKISRIEDQVKRICHSLSDINLRVERLKNQALKFDSQLDRFVSQ